MVVDVLAAFWARFRAMVLDVVWTTQSLAEPVKPIDDVVTARATCADVICVLEGHLCQGVLDFVKRVSRTLFIITYYLNTMRSTDT